MKEFGIDHGSIDNNTNADYAAAYAAGCRFAILRATWGSWQDPIYHSDGPKARAAGMSVGSYLFLRSPRKMSLMPEPEAQAQAFAAYVGPLQKGDLPPTIDVEYPGNGRKDTTLSARQAIEWVGRARAELLKHYRTTMEYTSTRVWLDDLADLPADFGEDPLWIKTPYFWKAGRKFDPISGDLPPKTLPRPWQDLGNQPWFQQIQGDATELPGFKGTVDIDLFRPMSIGERSGRVKLVQDVVGAGSDGIFGPHTEAAVKAFQHARGLQETGAVDLPTFSALFT